MKYYFLKIFLFCTLVGILAGVLSSSLVYSYFLSFMDIGGILMEKQDTSLQIKMRLLDEESKKNVLNSIVSFYRIKPVAEDPLQNIFLEKDKIAYGFVVTSDGWVVADKAVSSYGARQIVAVAGDGKTFEIIKTEKDIKNNLSLIRLDASGLKPISFGSERDLMPAENLYLVSGPQKISRIYFGGIGYRPAVSESSAVNSSELFGKTLFFGEGADVSLNGLPIVNYRGEAVGIVRGDGKIVTTGVPLEYIQKSLQSLFKNGKIKQVFLGVKYLDLAHVATIDEKLPKRGAVVLSVQEGVAGLEEGDIVTHVNGEELNGEYNLSEILSDYQAGDELQFRIIRDSAEQNIILKIGKE